MPRMGSWTSGSSFSVSLPTILGTYVDSGAKIMSSPTGKTSIAQPQVYKQGTNYIMVAELTDTTTNIQSLGLFKGSDGVTFTYVGELPIPSGMNFCKFPSLFSDNNNINVIFVERATSSDKYANLKQLTCPLASDATVLSNWVLNPTAIYTSPLTGNETGGIMGFATGFKDGNYYIYVTAWTSVSTVFLLKGTSLSSLTKSSVTGIMPSLASPSWEAGASLGVTGNLIWQNGKCYMLYYMSTGGYGIAETTDYLAFTKYASNPLLASSTVTWGTVAARGCSLLYRDGKWRLYFQTGNAGTVSEGVGCATLG